MDRRVFLKAIAFVLLTNIPVSAQQESREAIQELDRSLEVWVTAYNEHNASALSRQYAEDGNMMVTTGERVQGRAAIEKTFAEFFSKNPQVKVKLSAVSRKFLTPNIVVEDGTWEESGNSNPAQPSKGFYTAVLVKQDGKWLVEVDRNWAQTGEQIQESNAQKAELTKIAQEYDKAILRQDADVFERLLSDDFVLIDFDGANLKKDEIISNARTGAMRFEAAKSDNLVIRMHGDTAILNGDWAEKGVFKGEPFDRKGRFATVLVKTNGEWKIVSDQVTEIKQK
jgi:uncharacterized protein (TIGR02246 family)